MIAVRGTARSRVFYVDTIRIPEYCLVRTDSSVEEDRTMDTPVSTGDTIHVHSLNPAEKFFGRQLQIGETRMEGDFCESYEEEKWVPVCRISFGDPVTKQEKPRVI